MGGKEMLCDELKRKYSDITGPYYGYNEVNEAIAELKAKLDTVNELVKTSKDLYDSTIESLKASHYADSVDAGMRERRLKRALWIARANRAIEKIAWFKLWNASISTMNPEDGARQEFDKWKNNLGKFLKKAENY
jgi:hypothetical protein